MILKNEREKAYMSIQDITDEINIMKRERRLTSGDRQQTRNTFSNSKQFEFEGSFGKNDFPMSGIVRRESSNQK